MKHFGRWVFNLLSIASLILLVLSIAAWVRSEFVLDNFSRFVRYDPVGNLIIHHDLALGNARITIFREVEIADGMRNKSWQHTIQQLGRPWQQWFSFDHFVRPKISPIDMVHIVAPYGSQSLFSHFFLWVGLGIARAV